MAQRRDLRWNRSQLVPILVKSGPTYVKQRIQLDKSGGIWGFQFGNHGPSRVRIYESNSNLVDWMQFG